MSVSAMIFLSSALRWNSGSDADHGRNELNRRIDQAIKAEEKLRKYWRAKNGPPAKVRRKRPTERCFGSKLNLPEKN
jgi:hypothetical protein